MHRLAQAVTCSSSTGSVVALCASSIRSSSSSRKARAAAAAPCLRTTTSTSTATSMNSRLGRSTHSAVVASAESSPSSLETSLSETQAHDNLIDSLLACKGPKELSKLVAENLLSFDQKFWIRVAARADTADKDGKERLSSLARSVMQLVEAVVQQTDRQLSDAGGALQAVLAAGADAETGEWELPLSRDALWRMRAELDAQYDGTSTSSNKKEAPSPTPLDEEAFLSNAFAWMRKAADDGKGGLVEILQKALQIYASRALSSSSECDKVSSDSDPSEAALAAVIAADEREWDRILGEFGSDGKVSAAGFSSAVRKRMEAVALGLPSGSYAQRVQAEFLKAVEERGEEVLGGKKKKK